MMVRDFEFERYRIKINKPLSCGDCADFQKRCKEAKAADKICGEFVGKMGAHLIV